MYQVVNLYRHIRDVEYPILFKAILLNEVIGNINQCDEKDLARCMGVLDRIYESFISDDYYTSLISSRLVERVIIEMEECNG